MSGSPNPSPGSLDRGSGNNDRELSLEELALKIQLLIAEAVLKLNEERKNDQGRDLAIQSLVEVIKTKPESDLARRARERLENIRAQDPHH